MSSRRPSTCSPTWAPSRRRCRAASSRRLRPPTPPRRPSPSRRPLSGATVPGGTVTITGTATDTGGVVGVGRGLDRRRHDLAPRHRRDDLDLHLQRAAEGTADIGVARRRRQRQPRHADQPSPSRSRAQVCPCSILAPRVTPTSNENDGQPIELGVKFRSDARRLHHRDPLLQDARQHGHPHRHPLDHRRREPGDRHVLRRPPPGWQEASSVRPSRSTAGHHVRRLVPHHGRLLRQTAHSFASAGVDSPPLHALAGRHGRAQRGLPVRRGRRSRPRRDRSSNYLVDVVFETTVGPDTTPPTAASTGPRPERSGRRRQRQRHRDLQRADGGRVDPTDSFVELRDAIERRRRATVTYDAAHADRDPRPERPRSSTARPTRRPSRAGRRRHRRRRQPARCRRHVDVHHGRRHRRAPTRTRARRPDPRRVLGGQPVQPLLRRDPPERGPERVQRGRHLDRERHRCSADPTTSSSSARSRSTTPRRRCSPTWVDAGGNLIAMRPDPDLAGLLGLTDAGTDLSDAYLQIDTAAASPGAGLVGQTIQFHGTADRYAAGRRHAGARHAVLHATTADDTTRPSRCAASAPTAARRRRSPTTSPSRSSTRARATRPGPARSATASRPDRSTTCSRTDMFDSSPTGST